MQGLIKKFFNYIQLPAWIKKNKNIKEEFENQNSILKTIIDNVPEIIFYKDKDGVYRGANKQCMEFYKSNGVDEFIGKKDIELPLEKEFVETCTKHDLIVMNTKKPLFIEEEFSGENGEIKIFETIKTPVINSNNEVWGIVGVVRDITERKAEENRLKFLSYRDSLTGLYNRAFFYEKIQELMSNDTFPIGIIMGDVNGLKLVNDTFGHIAGDKLIVKVAEILKEACTENELIFRWGGDEFIILTANANYNNFEKLVQDINIALDKNSHEKIQLSMSIGCDIINDKNKSIDEAISEAEAKLYRQKILSGKSISSTILSTLQESLEFKTVETSEHTKRVLDYSIKIGKKLKLKQDQINELSLLAKLHDIGMIGIPESILKNLDNLNEEELEIMKTHTEKGYRLAMTIPEISHVARGILTHHERWDGKGYPLGIKGEDIPLIARIISVVDAYDSMTNGFMNNNTKEKEEALEEIKKLSSYEFDPNIVKIFCEIIEKEI